VGDREQHRLLQQQFLALLEHRLGEAGILPFAGESADPPGDTLGALAGREVREVGLPALGFRDDRARDADDLAALIEAQVDLQPDDVVCVARSSPGWISGSPSTAKTFIPILRNGGAKSDRNRQFIFGTMSK
jgi:hypothetical protein